jgi:TP901 family phage tail tape measure protein
MAADGSILIDSRLNTKDFNNDLKSLGSVAQGALQLITEPLTAITIGIGAVTKESIGIGIAFESAFANVKKTVDASDAELSQMREQFRELSTIIPVTASELANVGASAGQLGIAKDQIVSFTRIMADLGVATNMTAETAATEFARFANIT